MTVLAIVGSVRFTNPDAKARAWALIQQHIADLKPDLVVSGGADGMDTWGVRGAERLGVQTKEFVPQNRRWEPDGFKARNIQVAEACTHLLRISCKDSKTYGSGWTADFAEKLGKTVYRYLI